MRRRTRGGHRGREKEEKEEDERTSYVPFAFLKHGIAVLCFAGRFELLLVWLARSSSVPYVAPA